MASLCSECLQRPNCNTLCPEAEAYVNQDAQYIRELLTDEDVQFLHTPYDPVELEINKMIDSFYSWPKNKQVETLLELGIDRDKIAKVVGITKENLRKMVHKIKKRRRKNT